MKKIRVIYLSLCISVITILLFYLYMNVPPCEILVIGRSMLPTIYPNDVVYGYAPKSFDDIAVGNIVVFWYPRARSMSFCHRIIEIRSDMIIICQVITILKMRLKSSLLTKYVSKWFGLFITAHSNITSSEP